jgi:hypothetical protein
MRHSSIQAFEIPDGLQPGDARKTTRARRCLRGKLSALLSDHESVVMISSIMPSPKYDAGASHRHRLLQPLLRRRRLWLDARGAPGDLASVRPGIGKAQPDIGPGQSVAVGMAVIRNSFAGLMENHCGRTEGVIPASLNSTSCRLVCRRDGNGATRGGLTPQ